MLESTTVIEKFIQEISNFQLSKFMCEEKLLTQMSGCDTTKLEILNCHVRIYVLSKVTCKRIIFSF